MQTHVSSSLIKKEWISAFSIAISLTTFAMAILITVLPTDTAVLAKVKTIPNIGWYIFVFFFSAFTYLSVKKSWQISFQNDHKFHCVASFMYSHVFRWSGIYLSALGLGMANWVTVGIPLLKGLSLLYATLIILASSICARKTIR